MYTDKHSHIEGSVPPEAIIILLQKYRSSITQIPDYFTSYHLETINQLIKMLDTGQAESNLLEYLKRRLILESPATDLHEFITRLPTKFLKFLVRSQEDLSFVIEKTLCQYGNDFQEIELFFCPLALQNEWLSDSEIVETFSIKWKETASKRNIGFVLSLRRDLEDLSVDYVKKVVREYGKFYDRGIKKIDICSDEKIVSYMSLTEQLNILKTSTQELTLHLGETTDRDIQFILDKYPEVKQFNHGIQAAFNPDLVRQVVENEIMLTICPLSNLFTMVVTEDRLLQALRIFNSNGVIYTICTDDSNIIQGSVYAPYEYMKNIASQI